MVIRGHVSKFSMVFSIAKKNYRQFELNGKIYLLLDFHKIDFRRNSKNIGVRNTQLSPIIERGLRTRLNNIFKNISLGQDHKNVEC